MSKSENRIKKKAYPIRLSEQDHATIASKAAACGASFGGYVRACAMDRVIPTRSREKQVNELRRLGGLLKHLYNEGAHERANIDPRQFMLLLAEIRMAIHRTEAARE
jgi:hypothetical protein